MSNPKKNRNKQVRLEEDDFDRLSKLVQISGLSESDVLRMTLKAGLPRVERCIGELFPEDPEASTLELLKAAEDAPVYKSSPKAKQKE